MTAWTKKSEGKGISSDTSQDEGCFQSVQLEHARTFFILEKKNYIGSGPRVINPDEKTESKL